MVMKQVLDHKNLSYIYNIDFHYDIDCFMVVFESP